MSGGAQLVGGFYTAVAPALGPNQAYALRLTVAGELIVAGSGGGGAVIVTGDQAPEDGLPNPTNCVNTVSFLEAWNEEDAIWERVAGRRGSLAVGGFATPSDNYNNPTAGPGSIGAVASWSLLGAWDGAQWDRLRTGAIDASHAAPALGALDTRAYSYVWDGTNTVRQTGGVPSDYLSATAIGADVRAAMFGYDGVNTWRRAWVTGNSLQVLDQVLNYAGAFSTPRTNGAGKYAVVQAQPLAADTADDPSLSNTQSDNAVTAKASAGYLLSVDCVNEGALPGYFQVFNKASDPVLADVPVFSWPIAVAATLVRDKNFFCGGKRFATGISYGFSSTRGTYTALAFTGVANVFYV